MALVAIVDRPVRNPKSPRERRKWNRIDGNKLFIATSRTPVPERFSETTELFPGLPVENHLVKTEPTPEVVAYMKYCTRNPYGRRACELKVVKVEFNVKVLLPNAEAAAFASWPSPVSRGPGAPFHSVRRTPIVRGTCSGGGKGGGLVSHGRRKIQVIFVETILGRRLLFINC